MKFSVHFFLIASFSTIVACGPAIGQDELGRALGQRCETPEVKKLMGAKGSCRVIVAPEKYNKLLTCTGTIGTLTCLTTFDPKKDEKLNLFCVTTADNKPQINQDFEANGTSHTVATIINKGDGTDAVELAGSEFVTVSSEMVNIKLEESKSAKVGIVELTYQPGYTVSLQNVQCR